MPCLATRVGGRDLVALGIGDLPAGVVQLETRTDDDNKNWLAVSTHLKNMLVKLDHLPR